MIIKLFKILEGLKLNLSFYFLILFSVVSSLLEILSISSILPLMGIIIDPEIILKHRYLENFFQYFFQYDFFKIFFKGNFGRNITIILI